MSLRIQYHIVVFGYSDPNRMSFLEFYERLRFLRRGAKKSEPDERKRTLLVLLFVLAQLRLDTGYRFL
jgi:hypothetical protein